MRKVIVLFTILFILTSGDFVNAKPSEPKVIKPYAEDWYVTPEDIIKDIVFPSIDKKVTQEYSGNDEAIFGWQFQRIVGIVYNNNHSYDISINIQVPEGSSTLGNYAHDLVKVRVSPSCDSPKIGCSHGFKVEIVEYSHLSG
ncbi:hypothetical protein EVU96_17785 [Bacillus infantis]|uniref:DUF3888 domain-containing protein n=2 Tax=Bacillales TaxID=1385 RepID=A0A5D4SEI3_9BACI|nr:hypothetical protein [Bacillus infantis]MCK6208792.1 hypothetical protein [Bacillus infantis]PLR71352.1 hypothetical protein CYJ37_20380 [Bacillus sp. UMB0728]RYI27623.1 hypothetical protein EVU96_17785 [Bacillus infantis]TYS61885.1 hypothetical protein FZD47_17470 [Bacillus infantis]